MGEAIGLPRDRCETTHRLLSDDPLKSDVAVKLPEPFNLVNLVK